MNARIRRLAVGLLACYLALFVMLNVIQVGKQETLAADPRNNRQTIRDFNRMRGPILTADNVVIAESVPTPPGSAFKFQRRYPRGELFGNLTGYYTFTFGSTQIEQRMTDALMGDLPEQDLGAAFDLFRDDNFGTVKLTIRADVQELAAKLLGKRTGSIVVMEPATGKIIAAVSYPRYDPNQIAQLNTDKAQAALDRYGATKSKVLLDRTAQERYMPGSSFKVITTGIALQNGKTGPEQVWPDEVEWVPPQATRAIHNYNDKLCGGPMAEVFARSCNIPFAKIASELGPQVFVDGAKAWGIGEKLPYDLPAAASSVGLTAEQFNRSLPLLAIGGFGQGNDSMVPMHMAMVASTVANGGIMMKPYVIDQVVAHNGTVLRKTEPEAWKRPIAGSTADTLRTWMIGVVNSGTARKMQLGNGIQAAAKTGTAQINDRGPERSNAWIIGFAPAEAPRYAVAIMLKGGDNDEISASTGGTLCGPIGKALLNYLLTGKT